MRTYRRQAASWMLALGLSIGLVACGSKKDSPKPSSGTEPAPAPTPTPLPKSFDWSTCDVLIKEGHDHGHGNMHGNNVRNGLLYPQEQRFTLHNGSGGKVTLTWDDRLKDMHYFQAHQGGALFGMLFTFKDAQGKPLNEHLTKYSDHYQIFFTIADKDENGAALDVKDFRTGKPINWDYYAQAKPSYPVKNLEDKAKVLYEYTYRDTKDPNYAMKGDGDAKEHLLRVPGTDNVNHLGLKGHFKFLDRDWNWDTKDAQSQLPDFYLKVSLKRTAGSKFYKDAQHGWISSPFYKPESSLQWETVFEFLLPVRIIANAKDRQKQYETRYWKDMGHAFNKTPEYMKENDETSEQANDGSSFHL